MVRQRLRSSRLRQQAQESNLILQFNDMPTALELDSRLSLALASNQLTLDEALEMQAHLTVSPKGVFVLMPDHLQAACARVHLMHWAAPSDKLH